MDEQLIITIEEFRKRAGKEAAQFSDKQIIELIKDLDFMATMFINEIRRVPKSS